MSFLGKSSQKESKRKQNERFIGDDKNPRFLLPARHNLVVQQNLFKKKLHQKDAESRKLPLAMTSRFKSWRRRINF